MGQEIGVTPLQTISLVSTIANDGVYTPPLLSQASYHPTVRLCRRLHPAQQHRVVTTMTAAEMKKMLEGVVLFGTARRAILDGYTVAGKTGRRKGSTHQPACIPRQSTWRRSSVFAGQYTGHYHRSNSRFAGRFTPGRTGLCSGVQAHCAAGPGVLTCPARSGREARAAANHDGLSEGRRGRIL